MKPAAAFLAFLVSAAPLAAAADPVADRQALMKEFGRIVGREIVPFVRGQQPYDANAVQAALEGLRARAQEFDVEALFPAGTESGGGTEAASSVWDDRAGFQAAVDKFKADVDAAVAARPQDQAALGSAVDAIGGNCSACHRNYRL